LLIAHIVRSDKTLNILYNSDKFTLQTVVGILTILNYY